jgi:hypothetical protein
VRASYIKRRQAARRGKAHEKVGKGKGGWGKHVVWNQLQSRHPFPGEDTELEIQ